MSDNPYPPLATLQAEPAAGLAPPGAALIRRVSGERFMNITGPEAAFFGHVYGVQLSIEEVFAFHDRELAKLGWTPDINPILSSGELRAWGWCESGRLDFRLAIFDPKQYDRVGVTDGTQYQTVYDARIQGSAHECPFPIRSPRATNSP